MSFSGPSHFTAVLAVVAIVGTAGSFWWAMQIRAAAKSGVSNRSADRASSSKSANRAVHAKDERSNKFALIGKSERPQPGPLGPSEDRNPSPERLAPSLVSVNYANPGLQDRGADMPLPIPPVQSERELTQTKVPVAAVVAPPLPAENPKRQARDARSEPAAVAAARPPKSPARGYYIEKFVEQGDAGEVRFRYRRQSCEPPNMPDVCFMPQESRRGIVVERR
jgi:hypothetical protein